MTLKHLSLSGSGLIREILCIRETWFGERTRRVLLAGSTFFRQMARGIALAVILLAPVSHSILKAQTSEARQSAGVAGATQGTGFTLPNPQLTPGAIRTTDAAELCAKSFRTKKYRIATEETKKKVCAKYGVKDCPHQGKEELDDLVALEIGGENVEANLWVQMAPEYHAKDKLENWAKKEICAGRMDVAEAQRKMSTNWYAFYQEMMTTQHAASPSSKQHN